VHGFGNGVFVGLIGGDGLFVVGGDFGSRGLGCGGFLGVERLEVLGGGFVDRLRSEDFAGGGYFKVLDRLFDGLFFELGGRGCALAELAGSYGVDAVGGGCLFGLVLVLDLGLFGFGVLKLYGFDRLGFGGLGMGELHGRLGKVVLGLADDVLVGLLDVRVAGDGAAGLVVGGGWGRGNDVRGYRGGGCVLGVAFAVATGTTVAVIASVAAAITASTVVTVVAAATVCAVA
jgi:hypothetical protein